ncbi:MAG: hypothetical protein QME58_08965 [Bacteroidota bacterium]|nr:hypothetical protein [Bacteroidota bacterium]
MEDEIPQKILIFSRDSDFCKSLALLFQSMYEVYFTTSIDELLKIINDKNINLVIADSPVSDGTVYPSIRDARVQYPDLFIVLLYVYKFSNIDLEKKYRQHVDALFYKPVNINQLTNVINALLEEKIKTN